MNAELTASWEHASETQVERSRWLVLAVVLAGAFMILLDSTIVNVAIPSIQRNLGASYLSPGLRQSLLSGFGRRKASG